MVEQVTVVAINLHCFECCHVIFRCRTFQIERHHSTLQDYAINWRLHVEVKAVQANVWHCHYRQFGRAALQGGP